MAKKCFTWGGIDWYQGDFYYFSQWLVQHGADVQHWIDTHPCPYACIASLPIPQGCPGAPGPMAISSISPGSGPTGTVVNIFGNGFKGPGHITSVFFGQIGASSWQTYDDGTIVATAPDQGQSVNASVQVQVVRDDGYMAVAATDFIWTAPGTPPPPPPPPTSTFAVLYASPATVTIGGKLKIVGTGFLNDPHGAVTSLEAIDSKSGKIVKGIVQNWNANSDTIVKVNLSPSALPGNYLFQLSNSHASGAAPVAINLPQLQLDIVLPAPVLAGTALAVAGAVVTYNAIPNKIEVLQELKFMGQTIAHDVFNYPSPPKSGSITLPKTQHAGAATTTADKVTLPWESTVTVWATANSQRQTVARATSRAIDRAESARKFNDSIFVWGVVDPMGSDGGTGKLSPEFARNPAVWGGFWGKVIAKGAAAITGATFMRVTLYCCSAGLTPGPGTIVASTQDIYWYGGTSWMGVMLGKHCFPLSAGPGSCTWFVQCKGEVTVGGITSGGPGTKKYIIDSTFYPGLPSTTSLFPTSIPVAGLADAAFITFGGANPASGGNI